ncbi:hypothetical protein [Aeromonas sp. MdU4]|uniref:hypothetical protein n=1 Tax=Aeromonas sp. MdU4 TaxID=3342819 RepID=UPI0035BB7F8A
MWFIVLPLVMLLGMTPWLMANNSVLAERQDKTGMYWARRLLLQHHAASKACMEPGVNCTGEVNSAVFGNYLAPGLTADSGMVLRTYHDGNRLISVLDVNSLTKNKGFIPMGNISVAWRKLTRYQQGAGFWQSNSIQLYDGTSIVVGSPPRGIIPGIGGPAITGP